MVVVGVALVGENGRAFGQEEVQLLEVLEHTLISAS